MLFNVAIALSPFFFEALRLVDRSEKLSLSSVLGTGQLLLVSAAVAAGAAGELVLVDVPKSQKLAKLLAIFGCIPSLIVSSWWFGDVSAASQDGKAPTVTVVTLGSVVVFFCTFVTGAFCVSMAAAQGGDRPAGFDLLVDLLSSKSQREDV